MPVLNKDMLAKSFRHNWVTKYPMDGVEAVSQNLDDSLTSLNWLHNLNIMNIAGSQIGDLVTSADELHVNQNVIVSSNNHNSPPMYGPNGARYGGEHIDYKTNPFVKPPYSYATLICMAMSETKKKKITLSCIYSWITKNFMYYRMADPSWQNSIRHNLSLNKCFEKVPRRKDEPGKGGFWRVNPEFSDTLENGVFKKRRISPQDEQVAKRIKIERDSDSYGYGDETKENYNDDPNMGVGLVHFGADGHDLEADEINWRAIMNQDISVEGTRVKTEHLIDVTDNLASPLIAMSPPMSDGSDELGLDSLLANDIFGTREPLHISSAPLDLTVTGTTIQPPEWWLDVTNHNSYDLSEAQLSTPVTSSPIHETDYYDYGVGKEYFDELAAAFDVDNLFDIENIPSPHVL